LGWVPAAHLAGRLRALAALIALESTVLVVVVLTELSVTADCNSHSLGG
jgi:hypothetical protein